jgi:hypothetical protein
LRFFGVTKCYNLRDSGRDLLLHFYTPTRHPQITIRISLASREGKRCGCALGIGLLFCASDHSYKQLFWANFDDLGKVNTLSMGNGETATKIALKPTQKVFKHTETHSCEGRF